MYDQHFFAAVFFANNEIIGFIDLLAGKAVRRHLKPFADNFAVFEDNLARRLLEPGQ